MASRTERKLVETFKVVDTNGREHEVRLHQEYLIDGRDRIPSLKSYSDARGGAVNRIDDQTFEILQAGVIAKRV